MTEELKPCPFCGGEAMIKERFDEFVGLTYYYISAKHDEECLFNKLKGLNFRWVSQRKTKEALIVPWNRRTPDDQVQP